MGRRSRLEICFEILQTISKGNRKPTRIMYKTNLSWKPLQEILHSLLSQGFIEEKRTTTSKIYSITAKGESVLGYYAKARKVLTVEMAESRN
jgi:predicted transcriptional regulator